MSAGDSEHFQCEFCEKSFTQNESHVEIHDETHTDEDEYLSDEIVEQGSLESSTDSEAPTGEKLHHCQHCSKSSICVRSIRVF